MRSICEFDCHVHTAISYCVAGKENYSINDLIALMPQRGIKQFAVTDHSSHFYFPDTLAWNFEYMMANKDEVDCLVATANTKIESYIETVQKYKRNGVLLSMELDYVNEKILLGREYFDVLDIKLGSIHWVNALCKKPVDTNEFERQYVEAFERICDFGIEIFAHPTRLFKYHKIAVTDQIARRLCAIARRYKVKMEINSHSADPDSFFVDHVLDSGIDIIFGSDAHSLREFGEFSYQLSVLDKCVTLSKK